MAHEFVLRDALELAEKHQVLLDSQRVKEHVVLRADALKHVPAKDGRGGGEKGEGGKEKGKIKQRRIRR